MSTKFKSPEHCGDENPFNGLILPPTEIDNKAREAVDGFNTLGAHLAVAMRQGLLPIDEAIVGKDVVQEDESGWSTSGSRLPVWLILEDTNLTGDPLFYGRIGTETCSYSLGSGTPNNFQTKYKTASKQEIMDLRSRRLGDVNAVFGSETAIGLDGLGRFLKLEKDIHLDSEMRYVHFPERFSVPDVGLKPSDFFDPKTELSSEQLVRVMNTRMKTVIKRYTTLLQVEKAKLKIGEPLNRPTGYYDARSGLIYRHENLTPKKELKKKKFLGIF